MVFAASRIRPSEEMNSVYIISAPNPLQIYLNEGSVTSSIGARNTGFSPKSMEPIFIFFQSTKIR